MKTIKYSRAIYRLLMTLTSIYLSVGLTVFYQENPSPKKTDPSERRYRLNTQRDTRNKKLEDNKKKTEQNLNPSETNEELDLSGRWAGWIGDTLSQARNTIGINLLIKGDSAFGYFTINWKSKGTIATETFKGVIDYYKLNLTLYESTDKIKGGGVFEFDIDAEGKKTILSGTWTRTRNQEIFNCQLQRVGNLFPINENPESVVLNIIQFIDGYARNQFSDNDNLKKSWEDSLRIVYNTFLSPETKLGDFSNFKNAFLNTLSDSVIKIENLEQIDDLNSIISVTHVAKEIAPGESTIMQESIYKNDYRLINSNGQWKILASKSNLLDRKVVAGEIKYGIPFKAKSSVIINNILPDPAKPGDTVIINYSILDQTLSGDVSVLMDSITAVTKEDKKFEIKAVVPEGTTSNPQVILKIGDTRSHPYTQFKVEGTKIPFWVWLIIFGIILFLLTLIVVIRNRRLAKEREAEKQTWSQEKEKLTTEKETLSQEKENISKNISQFLKTDEQEVQMPDPEVPQELSSACLEGKCILFVSAELSALAGYPNRQDYILHLINWSVENKYLTNDQKELLISSIKAGRLENALENTILNLQNKQVDLADFLKEIYKPQPELPEVFNSIKNTAFEFIVTSNFDNLLERTFDNSYPVYTHNNTEELKFAFINRKFFIFKIYGKLEEPTTLVFTPSQFDDLISQNLQLSQFIENIFYSRTVFCIGASIDVIERFMNSIKVRGNVQQKHFALVGVRRKDWESSAQIFEKRFGIKCIPYTHGNISQLKNFMKKLSEEAPIKSLESHKKKSSPLKKIILKDVGPFENLELELDEHWNILLGDNGVGKSTILKAIAVAICGKVAEPYAHRLIRNSSTTKSATVTLITENGTYVTSIKDNITRAEITANVRPTDVEGWLALGFPPLRTISWETSSEAYAGQAYPISDDILPLVIGDPDPRMDELKRWLIDLKGSSTGIDPDDTRPKNNSAKLLDKFFQIIDDLTPNLTIKYFKIEPKQKRVLIETQDGPIPIESISQGTLSLISWVGILLQRLYEVYGDETEDDPTKKYALILMDEIDAHMHPEWQHSLIYSLNRVFPNLQFIVSTHSPLVVGGLDPKQILKFTRDSEGKVQREDLKQEDTLGRADQILTGKGFGMNTTFDKMTQEDMNEYEMLLGMSKRKPEDEKKFRELEAKLEFRIPASPESPDERKAQKKFEESLESTIKNLSEEEINNLKQERSK